MSTETTNNITAMTIPIVIFSVMIPFFTFVYTLKLTGCYNYWDEVQISFYILQCFVFCDICITFLIF